MSTPAHDCPPGPHISTVHVGAREPGLFTGPTTSNQPRTYARRAARAGRTFFSSSSSSFHLAPRSFPISPVRRVPSAPVAVATDEYDRKLTETGIGVLSFDPLAPVLAKEHVRGQGALGCLGVLLPLGLGRLLRLLGGLALSTKNSSAPPNASKDHCRDERSREASEGMWRAYTNLGRLGRLLGHLQRHKHRQRSVQHVAGRGGSVPTRRTRSRSGYWGTRLGATRRPAHTARRGRRQRGRIDRAGGSDKRKRAPIHTSNWLRRGDGVGGEGGVVLGRGRVEGSARRRRIGRGKWLVAAGSGWLVRGLRLQWGRRLRCENRVKHPVPLHKRL